jgi:hypothetical protein
VASRCTVLIAAADRLPLLETRASADGGELLKFSDSEALRALEAITSRRPDVVALERQFAATPRGAALINRIKADPALAGTDIRVVSTDPAQIPDAPAPATVAAPGSRPAAALDEAGTREAPRHTIASGVEVLIERNTATLIDLSTGGAQVSSVTVLKPNQRVRVTISDDKSALRIAAVVAWATFEMVPNAGPRYRAGLQFLDADAAAVEAFARRHLA